MSDLQVGDLIELTHGPFASTWRVVEIIDPGARLSYCGDVRFVGYSQPVTAPNGAHLTEDPHHAFLGRAHLHEPKRVPAP